MEAIKKFPSREHSAMQQQCQSKKWGQIPFILIIPGAVIKRGQI
jgi:hypothetical protein